MATTSPPSRARARVAALFAALGLIAALLAVNASFAGADSVSTADYLAGGRGEGIKSADGQTIGFAGEMPMSIDGGPTIVGYCIDLNNGISTTSGQDLPEVDWGTSGILNLNKVSFILNTYSADSSALAGSANDKAAAIQAAIWHLTDGFDLHQSDNDADVIANYNAILASIPADGLPPEPPPSLTVTPPSATAPEGQRVGPFTVGTSAATAALTSTATLFDAPTGGSSITSTVDGGQFWVEYPGVIAPVDVTATATATVETGRVFFKPGVQRLITADSSERKAEVTVTANWLAPAALQVEKTTTGVAPDGGFEFTLTGPGLANDGVTVTGASGPIGFDGTELEIGGEYTLAETSTSGWDQTAGVCTVNGQSLPTQSPGDGSVTFTVPDTAQDQLISCAFTNERLYDVSVVKAVTNPVDAWNPAGFAGTDTFDVTYECERPNSTTLSGTLTIGFDQPGTIEDVPHDYTCAITGETAFPVLTPGFAWLTPNLGSSVPVDQDGREITVTNTFEDQRERFTVTKDLVNLSGSGVDESTEFDITVQCGAEVWNEKLADGESWTSPLLPLDVSCVVTEDSLPALNPGFSFNTPVITPEALVTGQQSAVTVKNVVNDNRGSFTVVKALDNVEGSGVDDSTEFTVDISCDLNGAPFASFDDQTVSVLGSWTSPPLPPDVQCRVTEDPAPGLADGFSWGVVDVDPTVAVVGQTDTVTVTNTVVDDRVMVEVDKELVNLEGSGVDDDTDFDVTVVCSLDETELVFDGSISVSGDPLVVGPVPVGYECTTTEGELPELSGGLFWGPVQVSPDPLVVPAPTDVSATAEQEPAADWPVVASVTVTNTVRRTPPPPPPPTGSVTVTKSLAGDGVGDRDETVTVTLACGAEQESITIDPAEPGPESVTISDLGLGTECTVTELSSGDGVTEGSTTEVVTTIDGAPASSASVTVVEGPTNVEVVNSYTTPEVGGETEEPNEPTEPEAPVVGEETTTPTTAAGATSLPRTGGDAAPLALIAGLLVAAGLGLAGVGRRRTA